MKIGIIGSNSGLAKYFIKYLMDKNIIVNCYDIHEESRYEVHNYKKIDFTVREDMEKIDFSCDYIFIFSGLTGPESSMVRYSEFIDINIKMLIDILDTVKKGNFQCKIVYPSSRLVYEDINGLLDENSSLKANSIYGLTKIFAEQILELYSKLYDIKYTVYRIGIPFDNLENTRDAKFGIFSKLVQQSIDKKITLFGDGLGKRTFTHINDICEVLYKTIFEKKTINQVFNIGGMSYTLLDIANRLQKGTNCEISFTEFPHSSKIVEVNNGSLSSKKLDKIIPIKYIDIMDVIKNNEE